MINQVAIKKILIADSQLNYTVGLRKGLTEAGYEVHLAEDGDQALVLARSLQPNLILSEVNLPQLNGRTLLRILRSESELYHIPVLFISNLKRTEERIETMTLGADDYITKPYYVEEVVARIEMILAETQPRFGFVPPNAFSGKLSEMNVVDLIQTLEVGQKSGILVLNRNGQQGEIYMQSGAITDARYETYPPEEALDKMFTWTEGWFHVQLTAASPPKTIKLSNKEVVSRGLKKLTPWEALKMNLPPLNAVPVRRPQRLPLAPSAVEKRLYALIDGKRTLLEIIEQCQMDDVLALKGLQILMQNNLIEIVHPSNSVPNLSQPQFEKMLRRVNQWREASSSRYDILTRFFLDHAVAPAPGNHAPNPPITAEPSPPDGISKPTAPTELRCLKLKNKVLLTKSELMMIREKLS